MINKRSHLLRANYSRATHCSRHLQASVILSLQQAHVACLYTRVHCPVCTCLGLAVQADAWLAEHMCTHVY